MAKTRSPLFSSSAHGKLARSLVYSNKKSGQIARAMHYPKKEPSLKQWTQRHIMGLLTAHWQCMTDAEHLTWNADAAALGLNIPGYQYFLKLARADLYAHHGLIIYFSFNESTGDSFYCYACKMVMGTLQPSYPDNCPIRVPSFRKEYGNALWFDGIDDYGSINWLPKLGISSEWSIEVWIKLDALDSGDLCVVSNYQAIAGRRCFMVFISNNRLYFFFSENGTDYSSIRANIHLTLDWTHLVFTLSPDNKIRMFINSVKDDIEGDCVALNVYARDFEIGKRPNLNYFLGSLDELRMYNRALSYNEIKKHYALLRHDKKRQPLLRL